VGDNETDRAGAQVTCPVEYDNLARVGRHVQGNHFSNAMTSTRCRPVLAELLGTLTRK
jgi:hypothetical protein